MRTYIVTIGPWSKEVEAEGNNQARYLGVQMLTKEAKETYSMNLKARPLWDMARTKLKRQTTPEEQLEIQRLLEEKLEKSRARKEEKENRELVRQGLLKRKLEGQKQLEEVFTKLPQEDKEWLTGFWEGDGSISADNITFYQKNSQILLHIRHLLRLRHLPRQYNTTWSLAIGITSGFYALLKVISENVVSQHRIDQINNLENLKVKFNLVPHKPTYPWFVGFWDAEGYVDSYEEQNPTLRLSISQKEPDVLEAIKDMVGSGRLNKYKSSGFTKNFQWYLEWGGEQGRFLIPFILKYSKNQEKKEKLLNSIGMLVAKTKVWKVYLEGIFGGKTLS